MEQYILKYCKGQSKKQDQEAFESCRNLEVAPKDSKASHEFKNSLPFSVRRKEGEAQGLFPTEKPRKNFA